MIAGCHTANGILVAVHTWATRTSARVVAKKGVVFTLSTRHFALSDAIFKRSAFKEVDFLRTNKNRAHTGPRAHFCARIQGLLYWGIDTVPEF